MFGLFTHNIDTKKIKNINDVTKITKFYISKKLWSKAHELLKQAKKHEKEIVNSQIETLDTKIKNLDTTISPVEFEEQKEKVLENHNKNIDTIHSLEKLLIGEESKYKFVPEAIKRYEDAVKSIKVLMRLNEWSQAKDVIDEVRQSEKQALDSLLTKLEIEGDTIFSENEKKKQRKLFNKKEAQLDKILIQVEKKERNYNDKITKAKFKIRLKKIKSEVDLLSKTGKNPQALSILKAFLEEYKDNSQVIRFYNKEKKRILKGIEKQQEKEQQIIKKNLKLHALQLAGKTVNIDNEEKKENKESKKNFLFNLKNKINIYSNLKEKIRKKRLLDEVTLLIEENDYANQDIARKKLANVHKGLTKEIYADEMKGYDLYGKILGADQISGDTFGLYNGEEKYNFFLGDATGHGIKAGLIVTLLTRLFNKYVVKKDIKELVFEINNGLKQDLKSRNFITGILFQINKNQINTVRYVGFGHEPMLVYRKKENVIEKITPGGLAAGIRMIKKIEDIKEKKILLNDGDIILSYSDGVIESKSEDGEFYGLQKLIDSFLIHAQIEAKSITIYQKIIDDLIAFRGGSAFADDTTVILLRRDPEDDIQEKDSEYIKNLKDKENLNRKEVNRISGKNKKDIQNELQLIKKDKQLFRIIKNLKKLYHTGEFLTLKQESIRYIKEGWIHKDINMYLKKALENESKYRINLKNKKVENKYNVLLQLYKSGDFDTVIREIEDVISKDGDI